MFADFTNILLLDTACDGDTVSNRRVKPAHVYGGLGASPLVRRRITRELKRQQRYPTAPRWYLPAIWGVLQQPRRIAVGRAGMGHLKTPQV